MGSDHAASPNGLRSLVGHIRSVEQAIRDGIKVVYDSEIDSKKLRRNIDKIKPGPVYSIVTPFKEDLSIDFNRLEQYINYAYTGGATQFYVWDITVVLAN